MRPSRRPSSGEEELIRLGLAGRAEWPGFAAELSERSGVDLEYRETGALVVAADRDDAEELRRLHSLQRSLGLDAEWLAARDCRRLERGLSPRVHGGVLAPQDASVDPRAVVRALLAAIRHEGAEMASGIEVHGLEEADGTLAGVATSRGTIGTDRVVAAGGAWSAALGAWAPPIRPVKGRIVRLRGAPLAERVVRTPRCYVVSRAGGEIVVGATVEERGFDTAVTAGGVHRLLEAGWEVLPDIEERELVEVRAGLRPCTPDNRPVVGTRGPDGLVWATGHHRNGVLLTPITAIAVRELLLGRDAPAAVESCSPARFERRGAEERSPA